VIGKDKSLKDRGETPNHKKDKKRKEKDLQTGTLFGDGMQYLQVTINK